MKKTSKRVMAYVCVPLLFSIIGIVVAAIALYPYAKVGYDVVEIISNDSETTQSIKEMELTTGTPATDSTEDNRTMYFTDIEIPKTGENYAVMHCDRIDLHQKVYFGDDDEILDLGLGQYTGSSIFGAGSPILIGGHHSVPFGCLQYVEVGDKINVNATYGDFVYEVVDFKVADASDKSATKLNETGEVLVLYTCYPFTPLSSYSQRLFVYCTKVSGPTLLRW